MNAFVQGMQGVNNETKTENGAFAYKSTMNALVDLFGTIGALRKRNEDDIERLFSAAFAEDALLATKMSFYARNVRGGLGERRTARVIWRHMAKAHSDIMRKNLVFVPSFGRWDDLYAFVGTPVEKAMWELIKMQFEEDMQAYNQAQETGKTVSISLMAKWLKSVNASNADTVRLGKATAKALGLKERDYRKSLAQLRAYLDVVEVKMTAKEWDKIKYSGVTSKAMTRYRKVFETRDAEGFAAYKESLVKGEAKVNASTLYPYDILEAYGLSENRDWRSRDRYMTTNAYDEILEQQWAALPNYVEGENNVLVMADTSGSMNGRPLMTSVGLAVYFAERNHGAFKDVFMTFSDDPKFVTLKGSNLYEKVRSIEAIVADTNIEKALRLILNTSVANKVSAEDMPKSLVIISDMEFNEAQTYGSRNTSYYGVMRKMFEDAGYNVPNIIFWNVDSRQDTFHASSTDTGVQLASGQSVSTFKTILANVGKTALEAVIDTLNDEAYSMITI